MPHDARFDPREKATLCVAKAAECRRLAQESGWGGSAHEEYRRLARSFERRAEDMELVRMNRQRRKPGRSRA